jgi:hypothetical protein
MTFEKHEIGDRNVFDGVLAENRSRGAPLPSANVQCNRPTDDACSVAGVSGRKQLSRPLRMHQDSSQVLNHYAVTTFLGVWLRLWPSLVFFVLKQVVLAKTLQRVDDVHVSGTFHAIGLVILSMTQRKCL